MTRPERYFIGPGVKGKLHDALNRVGDMPLGGGPVEAETRITSLSGGTPRPFRGTFTGSWGIGETKSVTLIGSTASTVAVTNYCVNVRPDTASSAALSVVFSNVMGTMTAVEVQHTDSTQCTLIVGGIDLTTLPGYDAAAIQLLGHSSNINPEDTNTTVCVSLTWFSVTQCSTATSSP